MWRHLLKMIQTRFRSNLWVLSELLVATVALWVMTDYFLAQYLLYHQPVGFDTHSAYRALIMRRTSDSPNYIDYSKEEGAAYSHYMRLVERLRSHPDIAAVSLSEYSQPYDQSSSWRGLARDTTTLWDARMYAVTPDFFGVFNLKTIDGEDSRRLRENFTGNSMVVTASVAQDLFGTTDVVGETIWTARDSVPWRIVGVVGPIRSDEYQEYQRYTFFTPLRLDDSKQPYPFIDVNFRLREGVDPARFEEEIQTLLGERARSGNFWISEVEPYSTIRPRFLMATDNASTQRLLSAVLVFLLANVFLSVIGTFWFRVNRRREELGLRMAVGSSRRGLLRLVVMESLLLLAIAALPALFICLNLYYLDLVPVVSTLPRVGYFCGVTVLTLVSLALIITLAVWYPAARAARVQPADALRTE